MKKCLKQSICFLLIFGSAVLCSSAQAETQNEKNLSPYFFIENGDPETDCFPLKTTDVTVNITGVIADVMITQKYANNGARPINARYIFPASTRAAVHGMKMKIGEKVVVAEIKERGAAQQKFDTAKKQGKSASLLKQQRPNVFSMNVANIMPKDTIDIELHYTELLIPTEGTYQFVYPTVVGPRYANQPEADAPETDKWIKNPYLKADSAPRSAFTISLNISTGIALQDLTCPSHETETRWENEKQAKMLLARSEKFGGDRDFILNYRLAGKQIESGLMLYEGPEENFFMLMVQPPERVKPADVPPREYIFVVDVSGSMHGFPLNTAKKLLNNLIGGLRETDKFNVILFAGGSKQMSPSSLPATPENIRSAIRFIDKQQGGGGTELLRALKRSIALPKNENGCRTILIVTDGYIAAERDVFHLIQENLNRTNFFCFGIGSSVNRYLIEGMAKAGQGEPFVVTRPREASETAQRFRTYVESPVLTGISVGYNGFETYDVEPPAIPDVFARRPVIVLGKWRGKTRGTIALTGSRATGEYARTLDVSGTKPLSTNSALRYLWARNRIGRLSDFNFNKGDDENRAEITTLGLTYNLLTAHTSFVAVDETVRNPGGKGKAVHQPLPLPKNVSNLAVACSLSTVPEPEMVVLVAILAMMFALTACYRRYFRSRTNLSLS